MSQAKVDQYKKEKANRKKIMAKEKAQRIFAKVCVTVVLLGLVGWAGYTGYQTYEDKKPSKTIYADVSAVSDYMSGLSTEE